MLKGTPVAPGIVVGRVHKYRRGFSVVKRMELRAAAVKAEIEKFRRACRQAGEEIMAIEKTIRRQLPRGGEAPFEAHRLMLKDPAFAGRIEEEIASRRLNASFLVRSLLDEYERKFAALDNRLMRERINDIQDVGERIIRNLKGEIQPSLSDDGERVILVARELSPSETTNLLKKRVIGLATDIGGATSHWAIVARALRIPTVVGLGRLCESTQDGDLVILDALRGTVIRNPSAAQVKRYRGLERAWRGEERSLRRLRSLPARTRDGERVSLMVNIEMPEEMGAVDEYGADGVGLYRTEFLFVDGAPGEEEQFRVYRELARKMKKRPAIIRTLDVGGDKFISKLGLHDERNPFLGLRAIRLCLSDRKLFETQLRAVLRASHYGNIKLMFPLISGLAELRQALAVLAKTKRQLERKGLPFDRAMQVGVMIEVPSAALIAPALARLVDFFSIGSNDLIQYTLAVDRSNEAISYLYEPLHPGVLKLLEMTVAAAKQADITVSICGEMASDPGIVPLLLGMGFDALSVVPAAVPEVKQAIRSLDARKTRRVIGKILRNERPELIRRQLEKRVRAARRKYGVSYGRGK